MTKGILIAGTSSGVGKTTVSLGLMAALGKICQVVPFKVGPDYIDAAYHNFVLGRPSYNLDFYTLGEDRLKALYLEKSEAGDVAVTEGVMGLFDGADASDFGSSAHMSKTLGLPVILVIDAGGMSGSAAAVALGFRDFDRELNLAGLILNKVGSPEHYELLKGAIEVNTGIPVLGYLPKDIGFSLPERHLGLVPAQELQGLREKFDSLGEIVKQHIDIDRVLEISKGAKTISSKIYQTHANHRRASVKNVKIAVAMDEAFNFYYPSGLELLEDMGAELITFSPLRDEKLPEDIFGLYIGGGFPEVFAKDLSKNRPMLEDVKKAIGAGLPTYAEGGGFMYLSKAIRDIEDRFYPMVGVYDMEAVMTRRLQRLGYVRAEITQSNILGEQGQILYGHEFHYSKMEGPGENPGYIVEKPERSEKWVCGYIYKNCLATYIHIDFYRDPNIAENLIASAQKYKKRCSR